jgi:hypothetical protein
LVVSYPNFGTGRLSKKNIISNCQSTLRNTPEEQITHVHHGGSLKSRKRWHDQIIILINLHILRKARSADCWLTSRGEGKGAFTWFWVTARTVNAFTFLAASYYLQINKICVKSFNQYPVVNQQPLFGIQIHMQ